jgi:hypothetical protein
MRLAEARITHAIVVGGEIEAGRWVVHVAVPQADSRDAIGSVLIE